MLSNLEKNWMKKIPRTALKQLPLDYFIKTVPIPVFELLVNLECSLLSLKERRKTNGSVMGAVVQRLNNAILNNYSLDRKVCFVNT